MDVTLRKILIGIDGILFVDSRLRQEEGECNHRTASCAGRGKKRRVLNLSLHRQRVLP
jgi:hypothetical protein